MLDIKLIKRCPELIKKKLISKGFKLNIEKLFLLHKNFILLQNELNKLRQKKNILNLKMNNLLNYSLIKQNIDLLNKKIDKYEPKLKSLKRKLYEYLSTIPNIPDEDVPLGNNCKYNQEIYKWGNKKNFTFQPKSHLEISKLFNDGLGIDILNASNISKSKFVILQGKIALLYRALNQFMIDVHTNNHGYLETYVPYICNTKSLYCAGILPKFDHELFYVDKHLALIPTSEVPLVNIVQGMMLTNEKLPIKLVSSSPCFRLEAGAYGKINKGLMRLHQFDKVELVQITNSNNSNQSLEEITFHAEQILQKLNLPYRKMLLCTGDMTFGASKTYDLEVWLPSTKSYIEVSSCSNMKDFQSRRMQTKIKSNKQVNYAHTLNGSGLAIGRTLIAILENYQTNNEDIIDIPIVLKNYLLKNAEFSNDIKKD